MYEFDVYVFTPSCTVIKISGTDYIGQFLSEYPGLDEFDAYDAITDIKDGLSADSLYVRIASGYALSIDVEAWFAEYVSNFELVVE